MAHMTKAAKTKAKATKKCSKPRCSNDAASPRAKFCTGCFKKNAKSANLKRKVRGGNSSANGVIGNSGNTTSGQKKKLAGKRSALRRSTKMLLVGEKSLVGLDPLQKKDLGNPRCADEAAREDPSRLEWGWWPHRRPMSHYRFFRH